MTRAPRQMKWKDPPDALALLGRAVALGIGAGREIDLGRGYWLAADPRGKTLIIGPDEAAQSISHRRHDDAARRAARSLREKFHGFAEGKDWEVQGFPLNWDRLGPARSIVYESAKINGGGDGTAAEFIHEFSPGATAYTAGEFVAIVGEKIRVDASGVRN